MEGGFFIHQSEREPYDPPSPHPPIFSLPFFGPKRVSQSEPRKDAPPPTHPPTSFPGRTHPEPLAFFLRVSRSYCQECN